MLHHLSAWSPTGIYPAGMALSMEEDSKLALYIERNSLDRILAANIAQSVNSNSGQAQPSFATRKGTHEAFLKVMNTVGRKAGNESEAVAVLRMSFGAEHALVRRNPTPQDSVSPQPHRVDQICFLGWYMSQSFSYGSGLYVDAPLLDITYQLLSAIHGGIRFRAHKRNTLASDQRATLVITTASQAPRLLDALIAGFGPSDPRCDPEPLRVYAVRNEEQEYVDHAHCSILLSTQDERCPPR